MGQTVNLLAMPSVVRIHHYPLSLISGNSSVDRALAFQAGGRGFEPRFPLNLLTCCNSSVVEHFLGKEEVLSSTLSYSSIVLDAVGRECMWREGYNFLHGTGHGVGSYLCVHEGPHQIRMEWMPTPLRAGMTLTDEPGLYLAGKFGVRIENTVLISDYMSTEFGKFLQIEPLTLCPIDTTPIDVDMLLPEEIDWLNAYHHSVYEKLSPFLDEEEKIWLENATKPIK